MKHVRAIHCGGVTAPLLAGASGDPVVLDRPGTGGNLNLRIADISRGQAKLPNVVLDLLDIAAYVYCADQAVPRGGSGTQDFGAGWRRTLVFHAPVREPDLWRSPAVASALTDVLGFLSEDTYEFHFSKLPGRAPSDQYFEFANGNGSPSDADEVLLFSGGLDSLAGALHEVVGRGKRAVLVSHRSSPRVDPRQKRLATRITQLGSRGRVLHVPVWANKDEALSHGYTQRSRSFLFAALGVAVATIFGVRRLRFYENGVTSINLPISEQILGSRATRTTHPKTLLGFERLFSAALGSRFSVQNPFLWKTKTDIVVLANRHGADLIRDTVSCSRERTRSSDKPHCGKCSQCIDRRFAVLAAGCAMRDPGELYATDLFTESRESIKDRTMLESYVRTAIEIDKMADEEFLRRFAGEISRVVNSVPGESNDRAARHVQDLYKRHAQCIRRVVEDQIRDHVPDLLDGTIARDSLLLLCLPPQYRATAAVAEASQPTFYPNPGQGSWTISYANKTITPAHSTGLGYIARLLAQPNQDIGCAALQTAVTEAANADAADALAERRSDADRSDPNEDLTNTGSAVPVADDLTKEQCRERLRELAEERRDAESSGDSDELRRINEEFGKIEKYLNGIKGRRGKVRKVNPDARRAQQNVSKAINRSLGMIEGTHADLARHLRNSLKIGTVCSYEPGGSMVWRT